LIDYYNEKLSAERLKQCYELAPQRVQQYLTKEANHTVDKIHPGDLVLELGCGYGRLLSSFAQAARLVIGIDTSNSSILLGCKMLAGNPKCILLEMDATHLQFPDNIFDVVVCIQNGISAFHVDQEVLIRESVRVTRDRGIVIFSSYSDKFWQHRLEWFRLQSEAGLLGKIDTEKTNNGIIVCKDGFTATTVSTDQFKSLTSGISNIQIEITEVDESSLFFEIIPDKR
jgi:2-polyprenyl-6-hydroxyphenyl methylase/3-demethylubiquinone-9 3-methyltransferase